MRPRRASYVRALPAAVAVLTLGVATLSELHHQSVPAPTAAQPVVRPIVGYADLHVHQFTNESMAGAWLYGNATGPMSTALSRCSGNVPFAPGRNHGTFDKVALTVAAGAIGWGVATTISEYAGADTGLHADRRHGYCQSQSIPGPGLCEGNAACNLLGQGSCSSTVCEWRSTGSMCRDKPGDGISVGGACNLISSSNCNNQCYWQFPFCKGNLACNALSRSECGTNVCSWQSLGSICRDKDGDGKSVGLACNTLGQGACGATCAWNPNWGSISLHTRDHAHDWGRGSHSDKASWPAWNAIAHQQAHTDWLYQAHRDGLRLMVMSALNNEAFCSFLPAANQAPGYGCGDMENINRQLSAAIAVAANPSTSWYQVAYTAADARNIIHQGKLAVILSVEASDVFNTGDPLATLQTLYNSGVRTLQPLHQFNSKLGGVASHDSMIKMLQTIKNLPSVNHLCKDAGGSGAFAKCDASLGDLSTNTGNLNYLGLTYAGKNFVRKMLNMGMPVDIAHMSERSIKDVETIVTAACNYPVYISHGHVRRLIADDNWKAQRSHEKTTPDWVLDLIKSTGGLFGLRTGADHYAWDAYLAAASAAGVPTSVTLKAGVDLKGKKKQGEKAGNEYHFAYALDYLSRIKGINVALGSDFNGLIPQMIFDGQDQDLKLGGLAHIGKLADLFARLPATGLAAASFNRLKQNSAEAYLKMWEKAVGFADGTACCPTPTVAQASPNQAWYRRANRITVVGANFTPHYSMQVTLRPPPTSTSIPCTDVEFVSSTQLRCTVPPLTSGASYHVTVRNGACGLETTKQNAYHASPVDSGPVTGPADPPFVQSDLRSALAAELRANRWLSPNASKINAVDWTHPVWDGLSTATMFVSPDRAAEDGHPQRDWDAASSSPSRSPVSPALEALIGKEDSAHMTDPITMSAACDMDDAAKVSLASANRWPADWPAQLDSICSGDSNVCSQDAFTCPSGARIPRVGQVTDAPTASCPFDVGATYATCPDPDNLAMGGLASFSVAPYAGGDAWRAVNNSTNGVFSSGNVAMAGSIIPDPWWTVDLGSNATVRAVSLYNRTDCCTDRVKQFFVQTSADGVNWTNQAQQEPSIGPVAHIVFDGAVTARYVRLQFYGLTDYLNFAEVKVWGSRSPGMPGSNIALGKAATLGTGYYYCDASNAVNGNIAGITTTSPSCSTTVSGNSLGASWQVDLGAGLRHSVTAVRIWNRQDCTLVGCIDRLKRFAIQTSPDSVTWTTQVDHPATLFTVNQKVETIVLPVAVTTRFVRIKFEATYQNYLQLNEVEVLGTSSAP
jgi:microsomal dipeptidase-like Zn-dependent dipeptidase